MKLCLAFMFQDSAKWLKVHLPAWREFGLNLIALDGGSSDDGANYIRSMGGLVFQRPFDWDFSAQGNNLIRVCEEMGYEGLIRLDPDETMFPRDIDRVKTLLETYKAIRFPRFNFVGDRYHYDSNDYPDYQTRAFRLGKGVRYSGMRVHETLEDSFRANGWQEHTDIYWATNEINLYHYGLLTPPNLRTFNKFHNYSLLSQGLEPVTLPDGFPVPQTPLNRKTARFDFSQPLDPAKIGARAPFGDEK